MKLTSARYTDVLLKFRRPVVAVLILVTLGFAMCLLNLKVNSSPYFLDKTHESRMYEDTISELFTNSGEQILVVLSPDSGDALDLETVKTARQLTEEFEALSLEQRVSESMLAELFTQEEQEELQEATQAERLSLLRKKTKELSDNSQLNPQLEARLNKIAYLYAPIEKVRSYSTIENLTSTEDEMDLHPLLPELPLDNETHQQFKAEVLDNPLFQGLLLSSDLKASSIQIELNIPKDDNPSTGALYQKILAIVNDTDFAGGIHLAGNPVVESEMASSMERDNMVFFPFVILIIAALLYLGFHSVPGVLIPLTVASLTAIWTLGLMVALGMEQNIVTTILPVFLLTVAVADAIHFYKYYVAHTDSTNSINQRITLTLSNLTRPLVLTSITTLIGFLALAWTEIGYIREFGLLMTAGVIFALIITLTIGPILVNKLPQGTATGKQKNVSKFSLMMESGLMHLLGFIFQHPKKVAVVMLAVMVGSLVSLQSLRFDQENVNNFHPDTRLRQDNDIILQHYGGTNPIDIWIDSGEQNGLYDAELIRSIEKIENYLEQREDIGYVLSPVDFLKRMYDLLTFEGHKLPQNLDSALIAQEIFVYENEQSQDIKHVIDDQHRHARIIVLGESDAASYWGEILEDVESMTPAGTTLIISGYGRAMFESIGEVIETNISSTVIALVLIGLVMMILFKSASIGLIGVLPLVLTVIMNFAIMALMDVAVDIGTTIIASIAFGIGIDYSIHFLSSIKRQHSLPNQSTQAILLQAMRSVGTPILINSLTLAGGFIVLTASNFVTLQLLGLFIAMTMIISAINALILIPVCYALLSLRKAGRSASVTEDRSALSDSAFCEEDEGVITVATSTAIDASENKELASEH